MTQSLAQWLALREAADAAARSVTLTAAVAERLAGREPVRIVDLGTGTGSNVRYLSGRLPRPQEWLLVDRDADLLNQARRLLPGVDVQTRQMDLGASLSPDVLGGRHLVTASALLDLVSESWLRQVAAICAANHAVVLFALTYNGRSRCVPPEPEDDHIRELMNRHQRTDKGFGPAAGPDAADAAARAFAAVGYDSHRQAADWNLGPDDRALQRELIEGWVHAALEIAPQMADAIAPWLARRQAHLDAGRSRIVVSHDDLAAWPQDVR